MNRLSSTRAFRKNALVRESRSAFPCSANEQASRGASARLAFDERGNVSASSAFQ